MRLFAIAAAALMITATAVSPAAAQPGWHDHHHGGWHHHRHCGWRHGHRRCW